MLWACRQPSPHIAQKWGVHWLELPSESQSRWGGRGLAEAGKQGPARASFPGSKENPAVCLPTFPSAPIVPLAFPFLFLGIQLLSLQSKESKGEHNCSFKFSRPPRNYVKRPILLDCNQIPNMDLSQIHKNIFPNSFHNRKHCFQLIFSMNALKRKDMAHWPGKHSSLTQEPALS